LIRFKDVELTQCYSVMKYSQCAEDARNPSARALG
jgi:hypothetical protein